MSENIFAPFMREALALAENGRWSACPNPTVGACWCATVRWWRAAGTMPPGQPHAEVECLRDAQRQGIDPPSAPWWSRWSPATITAKTPPCSEAVLAAGIKRVVIGLYDPTPKAAGGAERLRAAGVKVIGPVCERECRDQVPIPGWRRPPLCDPQDGRHHGRAPSPPVPATPAGSAAKVRAPWCIACVPVSAVRGRRAGGRRHLPGRQPLPHGPHPR